MLIKYTFLLKKVFLHNKNNKTFMILMNLMAKFYQKKRIIICDFLKNISSNLNIISLSD